MADSVDSLSLSFSIVDGSWRGVEEARVFLARALGRTTKPVDKGANKAAQRTANPTFITAVQLIHRSTVVKGVMCKEKELMLLIFVGRRRRFSLQAVSQSKKETK